MQIVGAKDSQGDETNVSFIDLTDPLECKRQQRHTEQFENSTNDKTEAPKQEMDRSELVGNDKEDKRKTKNCCISLEQLKEAKKHSKIIKEKNKLGEAKKTGLETDITGTETPSEHKHHVGLWKSCWQECMMKMTSKWLQFGTSHHPILRGTRCQKSCQPMSHMHITWCGSSVRSSPMISVFSSIVSELMPVQWTSEHVC